jgi:hypothetical protein
MIVDCGMTTAEFHGATKAKAQGVAGVLWRRHMKTLTTTFLSGNRGKQSHPLFQWFAEQSKQHIRCLAAPDCVELLF